MHCAHNEKSAEHMAQGAYSSKGIAGTKGQFEGAEARGDSGNPHDQVESSGRQKGAPSPNTSKVFKKELVC